MKSLTRRALRLASATYRARPQVRVLEDRITPDASTHYLAVSNFNQNWSSATLITANDDWSGVPSVVGFSGDDTIGEGVDPQTLLTPYSTVNIIANQSNTALTTGGLAEFFTTVALQPDATADAPNLVLFLNTIGSSEVSISYNLRDMDATTDNAVQPVALQYRIGNFGNFINVPAGFVADATDGPGSAGKVTPVTVALPSAVNNYSEVQVRIITTNAVGNDEWVAVDDILVVNGTEFAVSSEGGARKSPEVAMAANGDSLVVWSGRIEVGAAYDIIGQRFDSTGAKIGAEFRINSHTTDDQQFPVVAMDADGDALVVWESYGQDGDSWGIFGQRIDTAGAKVGGEFQVNTFTTSYQYLGDVALDADGDFIVVFDYEGQAGADFGIIGQRFNSAGAKVGGEFLINTYTTNNQRSASVAMDAAGNTVVVWLSKGQDGDDYGVYGQRYDAAGASVGSEFQVNTHTDSGQRNVSLAVDADGDAIVVWESFDQDGDRRSVHGQRYDSAGAKVGGEFQINSTTTEDQRNPSVAMDADGDAVVVWTSYLQDGGLDGVFGQRFNSAGAKVGGEFQVNIYATGMQDLASVAVDADGDALVVWQSGYQNNGIDDIYGRRYRSPNPDPVPHNLAATVFQQNWINGSLLSADNDWIGVLSVVGYLGDDFIGTGVDPQTVVTPYLTRSAIVNQGSNTALSTGGVAEFDGLTNRVVALQGSGTADAPNIVIYLNTLGQNRVAVSYNLHDLDGTADDAVQPVALQYRIGNTGDFINVPGGFVADATSGPNLANKVTPVSAILPFSAGNQPLVQVRIITTNASGEDEWVGVDDILIRSEFVVNADGDGSERAPSVAVDDDGDALVVWHTTYEIGLDAFGVYGQRYNSSGAKVGGEFLINTPQLSAQLNASVAMDADGDAVVVWQSQGQDGSGYGIFGQRFDAAGAMIGGEFQINTLTTGTQNFPVVAMDDDGDFMVVWNSQVPNGPDQVFGQRFDAAGAKVGGEVQISTNPFAGGLSPSVSMDSDGDTVVVWHSFHGSFIGIYGQRFDTAGAKIGGEFQINTTTADQRINASVALDADGDALVVWQAIQDGDLYGIYGQRFNPTGAKVGGEFQINTYATSFQNNPAVALDADGDAVVTWESQGQDGSAYGTYGQRFNSAGAKIGGEFQVNIHTMSNQRSSAVAMDADGDAMVVWHSYVGGGAGYEVYGQRFDRPELPAIVSNFLVNHSSPGTQRSMVTSLQVSFDSKVSFNGNPAAAFSLINQKTGIAVTLSAAVDLSGKVVTLNFTGGSVDLGGSLSDGRYSLTILANQFAGNGFDGNADGMEGDDNILVGDPGTNKLFRLFGDADGSGQVTSADFLAFRLAFLSNSMVFDYNGSGSVDSSDFLAFRLRFLQSV